MPRGIASACLLLLVFRTAARADIAPDPEYGQTLAPKRECEVSMDSEEVRIVLTPEGATVRASFDLRNTGPDARFEVGFPDAVVPESWSWRPTPGDRKGQKLRAFEARVDGESVEVAEREGWLVWEMTFPAGGGRRVEVSYGVLYGQTYGPTLLAEGRLGYILRTGAGWKGPIGRALVTVECAEGFTRANLASVAPEGYRETETGVVFDLRDFEPTRDVRIVIRRHRDHAAAARAYLAAAMRAESRGDEGRLAFGLSGAALCLERAERWEACLAVSRRLVAMETGRPGKREHIALDGRGVWLPWECRETLCLKKLGRWVAAHEAAKRALAAIREASEDPALRGPLHLDRDAADRFIALWAPEFER